MSSVIEKLLELSGSMKNSRFAAVRFLGSCVGYVPIKYCAWLEKRLFQENWDPARKYRKKKKQD